MTIFEKLDSLDRRWVFAFQALVFCIVILKPVGLALTVGDQVRTAYETIDSLPAGSIVWFGTDYQAANAAELEPAALAILKHCFEKNLRVIGASTWPEGGAMMARLLNQVTPDFPDKEYGVDFLNLGYRPGGQVWLQQLTDDLPAAVGGVDHFGDPISEYPIMDGLNKIQDVALIVGIHVGTPGTPEYIRVITDPHNVPMITVLPAVSVAVTMPYLASGQLVSIVASLRGGAEYELISGFSGTAMTGMDSQSFMNLTIVIFVILGNIGFFYNKYKKGASGGGGANV